MLRRNRSAAQTPTTELKTVLPIAISVGERESDWNDLMPAMIKRAMLGAAGIVLLTGSLAFAVTTVRYPAHQSAEGTLFTSWGH